MILPLLLLLQSFSQDGSMPLANPPNVLVIVLDDWGWPERSITPSLDGLARVGVTFDRFYVEPVCSTTRYAALTGRWPRRAGIGDVVNAFDSASGGSPAPDRLDVFLPEALKPSRDTWLVGKWHLGRASEGDRVDLLDTNEGGPFVNGFDQWRGGSPNSLAQPRSSKAGYYDWYRVENHEILRSNREYATDVQRDAFLNLASTRDRPWFCWLAFNAPHMPYDSPPGRMPTGTDRGDYIQVVDYLDGALAAVLGAVDLDDTFVFVLGDNGTPDNARPVGTPSGYWKTTTYEGGVRVPLLVAGPGIEAKSISHRLVSIVDLGPTILELVGVSSRGFEDGVSFADELGHWSGEPPRSWLLCERYDVGPNGNPAEGYDDTAYVEEPTIWPRTMVPVRLKRRIVDLDGVGPGGFQDLVYDLISDPHELAPGQFSLLPTSIRERFDGYSQSLPPRR